MNVNELLDTIGDILDESGSVPFSTKRMVDVNQIRELVDEIRANLPGELRQSQAIVNDRTQIVEDANGQAEAIIKKAEERARILISETEVVKAARQQAMEILNMAQTEAKAVRQTVTEYCENTLRQTEETLVNSASDIRNIRSSLRQSGMGKKSNG